MHPSLSLHTLVLFSMILSTSSFDRFFLKLMYGGLITKSSLQRSNYEEAVELLKLSLDSCKQLPLPLILFYEELVLTLQNRTLHPAVMEWCVTLQRLFFCVIILY